MDVANVGIICLMYNYDICAVCEACSIFTVTVLLYVHCNRCNCISPSLHILRKCEHQRLRPYALLLIFCHPSHCQCAHSKHACLRNLAVWWQHRLR